MRVATALGLTYNVTTQQEGNKKHNNKRQALFADAEAGERILTVGLLKLQTMLSSVRC
jgi:hypothetical protein